MISSVGGGVPVGQPRSIEQITKDAGEFEYNDHTPLRNWLRTARQLRQQAEIYEAEGGLQQAYLLYYRQAILVLERLPNHHEVKGSAANKTLHRVAKKDVEISLNRLEQLKPLVKHEYDRYLKREEAFSQKRREAQRRASTREGSQLISGQSPPSSRPSSSSYEDTFQTVYYDGHKHQELALRVAQQAQGAQNIPSSTYRATRSSQHNQNESLSQGMQNLRLQLDGRSGPTANRKVISLSDNQRHLGINTAYPSVRPSRPAPATSLERQWEADKQLGNGSTAAPSLPGKVPFATGSVLPARPPKEVTHRQPDHQDFAQTTSTTSSPSLPPKARVEDVLPATTQQMFKPSAYLENSIPLRTVFFPPGMRRDFLQIAHDNTLKQLETCGILCGFLRNNALFVSSLVVPEQTSTSDTCEMTDAGEIALFDWVDGHDLLTLGWIHTHPTQTCFMSSRDLHTHCGYQSMIQESVAVVCAPSIKQSNGEADYGIFRLTDPPGMPSVRRCTDTRVFHPHDVDNLYTDCQRPGHVVELEGLSYNVFDLRDGKK